MQESAKRKIGWCLALCPLVLLLFSPFVISALRWVGAHLPPCLFYQVTGFACPGCGNTRSVLALLRGDILASLRYNIFPVMSGVILLLFYAELWCWLLRHPVRLVPRKNWFLFTLLGIFLGYVALRNFIPFLAI
jgi:hypothetical protein